VDIVRERTMDEYSNLHTMTWWNNVDGDFMSNERVHESGAKFCRDVVCPKYHTRIRKGEIINNECLITHDEYDAGKSDHFYRNDAKSTYYDTTWGSQTGGSYNARLLELNPSLTPTYDQPWPVSKMIASAKLRALAAIDSTPYSFAEDLAELGSTFRYISDVGKKARKLTNEFDEFAIKFRNRKTKHLWDPHNVTSLRPKLGWKSARNASELWLEYRFVMTPLVRSVADLLEAYNTRLVKRPERMTARGFEKSTWDESVTWTASGAYNMESHFSGTSEVRAGILYTVSNSLEGFRFKYGLRNKDIPVTMWNIVPLSFMVDRVSNISNAIKSLTNLADPDIKINAAWVVDKTEKYDSHRCVSQTTTETPYVVTSGYVTGAPVTSKSFVYDRDVWIPTVADVIPGFDPKNLFSDISSTADVLALILTRLIKGQ